MTRQNENETTFLDDVFTTLSIHAEENPFVTLSQECINNLFSNSQILNDKNNYSTTQNNFIQPQNQPQVATVNPTFQQEQPLRVNAQPQYSNIDISQLDFQALETYCRQCQKCSLAGSRKQVVFGQGNPNADLMFIGEDPGPDEDNQGVPFVGPAGQLLTKMINAMQFQRSEVYLANIVKCRTPDDRSLSEAEVATCLPFLNRQIELIQPKVIVLLGAVPLKYILNLTGISKQRGIWTTYHGIRTMPTFHPAYLLRTPSAKGVVWEDLQKVMRLFGKVHNPVSKR